MLTLETKAINTLSEADLQACFDLLLPYYDVPSAMFGRDIKHCNCIYIVRKDEKIVSYFMSAWETLMINGDIHDSVFCGLTCVDLRFRHTKQAILPFIQFILDAYEWEQKNKKKLIQWCTTVTPTSYLIVNKMWGTENPDMEGRYNEYAKTIALAIKKEFYKIEVDEVNHPFVLKRVAYQTNYSSQEVAFQKQIIIKKKITIFDDLAIDERQGDRLLLVMETPAIEKIESLWMLKHKILSSQYLKPTQNLLNYP
jgi:hypothetical protein